MSNHLVIVAIPAADDPIWKVSSEKIPHLTLLFLGDSENNPNITRIYQFVAHALTVNEHGPCMLSVDYRGVLGDDKADVLFFEKDWSAQWFTQLRSSLLKNTDIRAAYESTEQFPEWQPHITLGYPETPAKEIDNERMVNWVTFDRIAVWTRNYEGPEFRLKWSERGEDMAVAYSDIGEKAVADLLHAGVKGMKWGVRKEEFQTKIHENRKLAEAKTREKRPAQDVKTYDTIGPSKRKPGKIDTKGGEDHPPTPDAIKVATSRQKIKKSGMVALSNKELKDVATRLQLEQQVRTLESKTAQKSRGKEFIKRLLGDKDNQKSVKNLNVNKIWKLAI